MSNAKSKCFVRESENVFNITREAPICGTENTENGSGAIVDAIISDVAQYHSRIAECLGRSLEYDSSDYSYYLSGTPVGITSLGCEHIGFSIHLSIYTRMGQPVPASIRNVARHPREEY
jgi:hypothetical protein